MLFVAKKAKFITQGPATARLWLKLFRSFEQKLLAAMAEKGFADISLMHFNIIRHLDPTGLTITELANDAGITKQAVGKIAGELVEREYLTIERSLEDRRVKYVRYTNKGKALLEQLIAQSKQIEKEYSEVLGVKNYKQMRKNLQRLLNHE